MYFVDERLIEYKQRELEKEARRLELSRLLHQAKAKRSPGILERVRKVLQNRPKSRRVRRT